MEAIQLASLISLACLITAMVHMLVDPRGLRGHRFGPGVILERVLKRLPRPD